IGGERSFESGGYSRTPIAEILPIEMTIIPRATRDAFGDKKFFASLTKSGIGHPILKITPDEDENEKNWMNLPELQGINAVKGIRPDAITLLKSHEDEPLLVINQVKDGKVASFLSDSSWKWSFVRAGEGYVSPYYEKLWHRLLLWLVNDPELKDIKLITDKTSYYFGDKPRINVLLNTNKIADQDINTSLIYPSGKEIQLNLDNETKGGFYSDFQIDEYGIYELWARVDNKKGLSSYNKIDTTFFLVEPPFNEISGPTISSSMLKLIADKTGGEFITIKDDPKRLEIDKTPLKKITGYKTVELWDNPVLFIFLIVTLTSEWLLRRRWGLR
ncbi:MAG: glutamine amidotransferase, partial [Thermodesulfobacteriota bacterium]